MTAAAADRHAGHGDLRAAPGHQYDRARLKAYPLAPDVGGWCGLARELVPTGRATPERAPRRSPRSDRPAPLLRLCRVGRLPVKDLLQHLLIGRSERRHESQGARAALASPPRPRRAIVRSTLPRAGPTTLRPALTRLFGREAEPVELEPAAALAPAALIDVAVLRTWARGRSLTSEQAMAEAIDGEASPCPQSRPERWGTHRPRSRRPKPVEGPREYAPPGSAAARGNGEWAATDKRDPGRRRDGSHADRPRDLQGAGRRRRGREAGPRRSPPDRTGLATGAGVVGRPAAGWREGLGPQ